MWQGLYHRGPCKLLYDMLGATKGMSGQGQYALNYYTIILFPPPFPRNSGTFQPDEPEC